MNNQEPTLHTYLGLCTEYYDLDKPTVSDREISFYLGYLHEKPGTILEPMCGSGRFLIPILEAGYDIYGMDASNYMLEKLYAKCRAKNLNPKVWHQFLHQLTSEQLFDYIFIPGGSFGLITDQNEVQICLEKIYEQLKPGGKFVFEFETFYAVPEKLGIWEGAVRGDDHRMIVLSSCAFAPVDQVGTIIHRYDLIEKGMLIKTEIENFKLRLYQPEKMYNQLTNVGFKNIKQYKAYDRQQEPSQFESIVICECTK